MVLSSTLTSTGCCRLYMPIPKERFGYYQLMIDLKLLFITK